jgi:hypothetical protein
MENRYETGRFSGAGLDIGAKLQLARLRANERDPVLVENRAVNSRRAALARVCDQHGAHYRALASGVNKWPIDIKYPK